MARTDKYPGQAQAKTGLITGKQGLYETSSTRKHAIGQRMVMGDGRVFYYAKNSSTATNRPGVWFVADIDRAEEDSSVTEAVGDKTVATFTTVGALGPAAIGGYFWSTGGGTAGGGQTYKIADVTQSTTSGASDIHLHDEIKAVLTAEDCCIANNPFYGVQRANDEANFFLGVALVAVPANYYFWMQTFGWVALLRGDSLGDADGERQLLPHASGTTTLSTATGALGKQLLGFNVANNEDVVSGEWHLGFITVWP